MPRWQLVLESAARCTEAMVIILRLALTAITAIIPTPARPTVIMARHGLAAASLSEQGPGSAAAMDSVAALWDDLFTDDLVSDMADPVTVAAFAELARFEADSPVVDSMAT
jgi:hypothetical protein